MRTNVPNNPGALQDAIERSAPGDVLVLPSGAKYDPIVFPGRHLGIRIEWAECERIAHVQRLPVLSQLPTVASNSPTQCAVTFDHGAIGVDIDGMRILNAREHDDASRFTFAVSMGQGTDWKDATSVEQLPSDITLCHCEIAGQVGADRTIVGVLANGRHVVIDCCNIDHISHGREEAQGVLITNTPGPVTIRRSRIYATTENIMAGGSSPHIPMLRNLDQGLSVERCELAKYRDWEKDKSKYRVKNLLELKNCWHAHISECWLHDSWADDQDGHAVLFTPREHNPVQYSASATPRPAPMTHVGFVIFRQSVIERCDGGINILASDDVPNQDGSRAWTHATGRIAIQDVVMKDLGHSGKCGRAFSIHCPDVTRPIESLNIQNVVALHSPRFAEMASSLFYFVGKGPAVRNLNVTGLRGTAGKYGIMADGGLAGREAIEAWSCRVQKWDSYCLDDGRYTIDF